MNQTVEKKNSTSSVYNTITDSVVNAISKRTDRTGVQTAHPRFLKEVNNAIKEQTTLLEKKPIEKKNENPDENVRRT